MSGDVGGANLPYAAKYLKDGYTPCSKCKVAPVMEELLLGIREFCATAGQYTDRWYHVACFFPAMKQKGVGVNEAAMRGMSCLKWEDQEIIRGLIETFNNPPSARTSTSNCVSLSSCRTEHAKSGRGKCGTCRDHIKEGEAKYFCNSESNGQHRGAHHHLGCFLGGAFVLVGTIENIQGYAALKQEAKDELKEAFDNHRSGKNGKGDVKVEVKAEVKAEAGAVHPSASSESMGGVNSMMSGGNAAPAASTSAGAAAYSDPLLEAARRMAQAQKNSEIVLGPDAAAVNEAAISAASKAAIAAEEDDEDDEIQVISVVQSDKPPVVTIGVEIAPIVVPQLPVPQPKPKSSLNDLFARMQKEGKRTSLSSVMEALPKKPRLDEELGKEELNAQLKKQADALWKLREEFEKVREHDIQELMRKNHMHIPTDHEKLIMSAADAALFGAPSQCPKCPDGQLTFDTDLNTYTCMGNVTEWTKCTHTNKNPTRSPLGIPRSLSRGMARVEDTGVMNLMARRYYPVCSGEPLKNALPTVAVSAELAEGVMSKNTSRPLNATQAILARVAPYLPGALANAISAPANTNGGKQFIKRGTVVDGECVYASEAHVYRDEEGTLFSCSLTQADMATNRNSYFKMQLLEHDVEPDQYYVFKSWGRVGTDLGQFETVPYNSLPHAKKEFLNTFTEKTGNDWEDKKYFRKRAGKMAMVDMDYSEIEQSTDNDEVVAGSRTKLEKAVQQLILRIFDKDMFKSALQSFDLDMEQMPLGKLSKRQLDLAYGVLNELQAIVQSSPERSQIIDATNRFYSLIPHNFGHKAPEMLDTKEIVEKKSKLIENLMDIAIAVDLMKDGDKMKVKKGVQAMDPIDIHYLKLKSDITVLPKSSPDYKMIETYTKNTHGSTHATKIQITDIFCVTREGEEKRFKQNLGNRMLLWHGSRLSNFVGIISQGLRIAPPEAPHAGYMFGKGIYFADMVSKSANYCHPDLSGNDAFLLLCEVALGTVQEENNATSMNPLKNGCTAVKGMGYQFPDPSNVYNHPDGYVVPYGKATRGLQRIYLEYNEYIVYDMSQVRIRYLVRTKMNWR